VLVAVVDVEVVVSEIDTVRSSVIGSITISVVLSGVGSVGGSVIGSITISVVVSGIISNVVVNSAIVVGIVVLTLDESVEQVHFPVKLSQYEFIAVPGLQ